jgi:hypothetical protein
MLPGTILDLSKESRIPRAIVDTVKTDLEDSKEVDVIFKRVAEGVKPRNWVCAGLRGMQNSVLSCWYLCTCTFGCTFYRFE